jgi:hypothetical protein
MPRFSDIFIYESAAVTDKFVTYHNCFLIKRVTTSHDVHKRFDSVVFDTEGMAIFFVSNSERYGPYTLTTVV